MKNEINFNGGVFGFLKGEKIESFLRFADFGSRLVFGDEFAHHFVVFAACPVGLFFAGITNLLYYYGIMQYFILKASWFVTSILHTSPTESMNAISSIFLGQV